MTTPNKNIDLGATTESHHAWMQWVAAKARADAAQRELKRARNILDRAIGDSEQVLLGGLPVAKYEYDGAFNVTKFMDEMPHLAKQYTRPVVTEEVDTGKLAQDHPMMFQAYRTRTLRLLKTEE